MRYLVNVSEMYSLLRYQINLKFSLLLPPLSDSTGSVGTKYVMFPTCLPPSVSYLLWGKSHIHPKSIRINQSWITSINQWLNQIKL